jgi:hypothetical protein
MVEEVKAALKKDATLEQKKEKSRERRRGGILGISQFRYNRPEYLRAGYKRHFFREDEYDNAYDADWEIVQTNGKEVRKRDGTGRDGKARDMILMEKPLEWYNEDRETKTKQNKTTAKDLLNATEVDGVRIRNTSIPAKNIEQQI